MTTETQTQEQGTERKSDLTFVIGDVEQGEITDLGFLHQHRFIISKNKKGLILYSARLMTSVYPSAYDLAKRYGVNNIMGGGNVRVFPEDNESLRFCGGTEPCGTVPNEILKMFSQDEILSAFRKVFPSVKEIGYHMVEAQCDKDEDNPRWARYYLNKRRRQA